MAALFSPHPLVLETAYSDLKRQASEQTLLLVGTPGSVGAREVLESASHARAAELLRDFL